MSPDRAEAIERGRRLMDAAPDLLEALEAIVRGHAMRIMNASDMAEIARDAIAKAEGKAP